MKIYKVKVNGKTYQVELEAVDEVASSTPAPAAKAEEKPVAKASGAGNAILSPIQGNVIAIKVKVGDKVKKGDAVVIVEAMKLENEVVSTYEGVVTEILVAKGSAVSAKQPLVVIA